MAHDGGDPAANEIKQKKDSHMAVFLLYVESYYLKDSIMALKAGKERLIMSLATQ